MTTDTPQLDEAKVAIVIATYNAEGTIMRAVESALAQSLDKGFELQVIVVDDCSTDGTPELVAARQAENDKLILIRQDQNGGPSAARNAALAATDAAWFTPLDSDDFMEPGRVRALLQAGLSRGLDLVADNLLVSEDSDPEKVVRYLWPTKPDGALELSLALFVTQNLNTAGSRSELGYIKPLMHRRLLGEATFYRPEMRFGEDYDLYTRLLAHGAKACLLDPKGYFAVQRSASLSRSQKAVDFERLIETDKALLALGSLNSDETRAVTDHLAESQSEWVWLRAIEAFKARSLPGFLSCFLVSAAATSSLMGHLAAELIARTVGRRPPADNQPATP